MVERGALRGTTRWVLLGALVPDLAMFGFFAWHTGVLGTSQAQIWSTEYFRPAWQLCFDAFNSIPLAALGALVAWRRRHLPSLAFFTSVGLHCLVDLALHHDDGHRHFLPLSWRFASPVSYWDPRHLGALGAGLELVCVLAGSALLVLRSRRPWVAALLGPLCLLYVAGYLYGYTSLGRA